MSKRISIDNKLYTADDRVAEYVAELEKVIQDAGDSETLTYFKRAAELEDSNAQYLKTCEDLTLDNIRYRQRAKEAEAELIKYKLGEPATFLPDCRWQSTVHRKGSSVTYCRDKGCVLFSEPCSKRCDCPEPKKDEVKNE